ncbi:hypothetical protein [Metamycoplasma gateae]|uniref:Uncharacterized protein n=1 Tax=Metamycoplasma gateae TaxID=35769 RepID=A0ABZ2AGP7_9BACT|nr:hypothetical protein V2E26_02620 [Metamycoplasma gateae]
MTKIISTIAEKLKLSENDVFAALNLSPEAKRTEILEALGVYAVFENKNELEDYLNSKIGNKTKKINELQNDLQNKLSEFNNLKNNLDEINNKYALQQDKLQNVIQNAWKNSGIKRDFNKVDLDYEKIDFSNLNKSLLEFATAEGFAIEKAELNNKNQNDNAVNKNTWISSDGVVVKN